MRALGLVALAGALALSAPAASAADGEELDALGHALDNYYLDFAPAGKIELPRLLLVRDGNGALRFEAFASTKAMLASGNYRVVTPAGYPAEAAPTEPAPPQPGAGEPPSIDGAPTVQEVLPADGYVNYFYYPIERTTGGVIVDFSISRHLVFAFLVSGFLLLLFLPMGKRYRQGVGRTEAPRGPLQNALETVVLYIRDQVARPNLGEKTDRFLPYLLTVFFFILGCNLFGLVPFGGSATANITITAVLALFTFFITQFAGTKDYWMHIFWPPGVPTFVKPILIPVEILGLFTKPFALAVRLFANMTAGKLVILNLVGLIFFVAALFGPVAGWGAAVPSVLLTLFIYVLKILVAFIQAYVFTILSALFIGMAAAEHHHDDHHGHGHAGDAYADPVHQEAVALSAPVVHGGNGSVPQKTLTPTGPMG
jgi:F-type H+-transporting ATPase subunit a